MAGTPDDEDTCFPGFMRYGVRVHPAHEFFPDSLSAQVLPRTSSFPIACVGKKSIGVRVPRPD